MKMLSFSLDFTGGVGQDQRVRRNQDNKYTFLIEGVQESNVVVE